MMRLLKNYKYGCSPFDNYPWIMPKHNKSVLPNMIWYFATYKNTVNIKVDININFIWDNWNISKIPLGYSLCKD